ncbi:MAG: tetratricopeptide repeat protein [Victivallales bacterium]|nr:tetratricopeptide repeat protein [Victivallales bacterium]
MSKSFLITATAALILMFFSAGLKSQDEDDDTGKEARKIWLAGFDYLEKGDKSRNDGDLRQAMMLYREALSHFETIKARYPKWNTGLIDYRIKVCNKKIDELKNEFAGRNLKFTETETDKENLVLKTRVSSLEKELKETKSLLDATYVSLEAARREAARNVQGAEQVEQLLRDKISLGNRLSLLEEQNKKLRGSADSGDTKEMLDRSLLQLEALKREKVELINRLETERQKLVLIERKNLELANELALLKKSGGSVVETAAESEKKNVMLEESLHQSSKEKEALSFTLRETEEKLKTATATIGQLREDIKDLRSSVKSDADGVMKKLGHDNELLLQSLETAQINLSEKNREIRDLRQELNLLKDAKASAEKHLAGIDHNRGKILEDLHKLDTRIFIADTITRKQDQRILEQKQEYEKLKKDFDDLVLKSHGLEEKKDEFSELARRLVAAEGENQRLKEKAETDKAEMENLRHRAQEAETRLAEVRNDMKKGIDKIVALEEENVNLKLRHSTDSKDMGARIKELESSAAALKKSNDDYDNKLVMLTNELVAMNSALAEKSRQVELLQNGADAAAPPADVPPVAAADDGKIEDMRKENARLASLLETAEKKLENLTSAQNRPVVDPPAMPPDNTETEKMLDEAGEAEKKGKNEAALWHYLNVLAKDPENPRALARAGMITAESGSPQKAIALLEKAFRADPDNIDLLVPLSFCYIHQEKYFEALSTVSLAISRDPKDPVTQMYLGRIFSHLEWNEAAEQQFRKSFKLDPTSAETAFNTAVLIARNYPERMDEAKLWYLRSLQLGAEKDPVLEKLLEAR